mmetsp:Transcript_30732/g.64172  ORF Transcript_30732/g.64172 Transcript_30732/m.64172 type:complete len:101 (-) Transcript_30732:83-385(-)
MLQFIPNNGMNGFIMVMLVSGSGDWRFRLRNLRQATKCASVQLLSNCAWRSFFGGDSWIQSDGNRVFHLHQSVFRRSSWWISGAFSFAPSFWKSNFLVPT